MKRLLSLMTLILCLFCISTAAGAYDLTKCDAVYDFATDTIRYLDHDTGVLVAVEMPNGIIYDADDYYEKYGYDDNIEVPEETSEPYDPYEPYDPAEEEDQPLRFYEDIYTDWGSVYVFATVEGKHDFDGCFVQRRTSGSEWTDLMEADIYDNWDDYFSVSFTDVYAKQGVKYQYRLNYYKFTDYGKTTLATRDIEAELPFNDIYSGYYLQPAVTEAVVKDKSVSFSVTLDERWDPNYYTVSRKQGYWGEEVLVGEYTELPVPGKQDLYDVYTINITDSGLEPGTEYTYTVRFYSSKGADEPLCQTSLEIETEFPRAEPQIISAESTANTITLRASIDERWEAEGFVVQRYNSSKKKWVTVSTSTEFGYHEYKGDVRINSVYATIDGLKSMTDYKCRIRFYKMENGKKKYIASVTETVKTLLEAPKLQLGATSKKAKLSWSKVDKATGYEIYVKTIDPLDDGYFYGSGLQYNYFNPTGDSLGKYNQNYRSYSLDDYYWGDSSDMTKKTTVKKNSTTSKTYSIKNSKIYIYQIRAYKKVDGKKIYSEYSNRVTTDSTEALLNGITLKPTVTVSDSNLKLIKAALKKCTTSDMSQAQKAAAIYDYVHNAATYEYNYSLIPSDPIEAILSAGRGQCYQYAVTYQAMMKYIGFDVKLVSGKTSSGGSHWWCELTCAGTAYMLDPQVGGRFLIRYDRMGEYTVKKEKVYD